MTATAKGGNMHNGWLSMFFKILILSENDEEVSERRDSGGPWEQWQGRHPGDGVFREHPTEPASLQSGQHRKRSPFPSQLCHFWVQLWKKLQVSWLSQAFSHNVCSECQHTNSTSSNSCVNFVDLTSDQLCKFWKQAANVRWHKSPVTSILSLSTAISLALGNGSQTFLAIRITWKIYPDRKLDLMPEFLIHQAGCGDWVFAFLTSSTAISARVFSLEHSNTGQIYTELTLRRKLNSNMSIPGEFFT